MYSTYVSSKMTINHKTGKTKVNSLDLKVNGYKNSTILEKAKRAFNSEELPDFEPEGERAYQWHSLYKGLLNILRNKNYILKNRNKVKK